MSPERDPRDVVPSVPITASDPAAATPAPTTAKVRQGLKVLASESIVYGLGQAGGRAVQLLLVPILTRALDPSAYGVSELVVAYSMTLITVLVLGMESALARFFYQEPDREAKITMVSTSFWFRLAVGLASAALIAGLAAPLAGRLVGGDVYRKYLMIAAVNVPLTLIVMFGNDVLRVTFQPWKYVALNLTQTLLGAGLAVWFVVRMERSVAGVLYGRLIGDAVAALVAVVLVRHMLRLRFSADTLRRMLAFGVPMLPALFAFAAISGVDRYLLQRTRTLEELAVYAVAMKFFTVMIFTASAFQLAYGPFAYARAGTPEAPRLYSRALSLYVTIGSTGALLVGLFAPEALRVLVPPVYAGAAAPALVLGFAAVGFGAYTVAGIGINLALKTAWASVCAAAGALVAVVANLWWTPLHGPIGAAAATWVGYVTAAIVCYVVAQRFTPLPYRGARLLALFLVASAAGLAGQRLDLGGAATIAAKLAIVGAFAALAGRTAFLPVPAARVPGATR